MATTTSRRYTLSDARKQQILEFVERQITHNTRMLRESARKFGIAEIECWEERSKWRLIKPGLTVGTLQMTVPVSAWEPIIEYLKSMGYAVREELIEYTTVFGAVRRMTITKPDIV